MTKVNPNNGNETRSQIWTCGIFKSGIISFLSKNIKVFQCLSKSKYLSFMTTVNQKNENVTKSDIFKSDIIFH